MSVKGRAREIVLGAGGAEKQEGEEQEERWPSEHQIMLPLPEARPGLAAAQAHADLLDLRVNLLLYGPFGPRVWELRSTLTAYDAWYVAVAEAVESPLATLDLRMSRAPGPRCAFRVA